VSRRLARRLLHAATVLVGVSLIAFILIHLVPGDPVRIALGPRASQPVVDATRKSLGLDAPLPQQYFDFIGGVFHGDLGYSIQQRTDVAGLIGPRVSASVFLLLYATLIALVIGVPLGLLSALHRDRPLDHGIRLATMVTFAMPSFWLALVLVEIFSLHLQLLPVSGYGGSFEQKLKDLLLPALTIGLYLAPMLVRTLRGSVIDVLSSDFVEAARARGLSERRVVSKHVLRNASIATLTVLAVNLGFLVSGTVVIEVVFDIPGLGSQLVSAVQMRDFALVQALTLVFGTLVVLINVLSDVAYALIDPRIRAKA
jgi:peptide/nickel transport system permease protein